jgi:hypothetical protein
MKGVNNKSKMGIATTDTTYMLANQSTTLPNSTNILINDSQLLNLSSMPVIIIPPSFPPESKLDYHKRLQTKLDKI